MNYGILTLTFLSVNLDFFVMLLFLLKKYRTRQVLIGYLIGLVILLTASFLIGRTLAHWLPEWVLGGLGLLPIWLAVRRDTDDDAVKTHGSPVVSVCVTYLSVCAGCNLAIFLPVLAGENWAHFGLTLIFLSVLTIIMVALLRLIVTLPVVEWVLNRFGEPLMRGCYVLIGLYVFWDSGLVSHLLTLIH
ncbi:cadmium resistance transporter [Lactiplantibacillus plajomi]|uniref:Cadmium resistance transporter n=1 Tax=Lactiplantibacillus plajomi TaxID=1457217 RepID=A0ABV6K407_9LACO|nr:cadmium resistance transporter [Lactiplantibacillus plajomi]